MRSTLLVRMLFGTVAGAATLGFCIVPASAAPSTTPAGYVGACNMLVSGSGMANAMSVDNPNGTTGMFRAVAASDCS